MRILVIGCGSIGRRHIKNLIKLNAGEILIYDKVGDIFNASHSNPADAPNLKEMQDFGKLLAEHNIGYYDPSELHYPIDAFVIATPPDSHLFYCPMAIRHGAHMFIEKPMSNTLEYIDWVIGNAAANNLVLQVGYQMRFHPLLRRMKDWIDAGEIGKVLSVDACCSYDLARWHPGTDFLNSYTAKEGIILDASHEIDYVRWLVDSEPSQIYSLSGKLKYPQITGEDTADIIMRFGNGVLANIHLDMVRQDYTRWCKVIGDQGTTTWDFRTRDFPSGRLVLENSSRYDIAFNDLDLNQMYLDEMQHFLDCCAGKAQPLVNGNEAKRVLQIALAAKNGGKFIE
ncbi:MAG: Gfo/Idh/MocA family oxidoreductase [Dehalococcoidia bacterium]|nr:Gfo/Idh/MocA family oxidoreductase [Dehalococcoidia bacterium]